MSRMWLIRAGRGATFIEDFLEKNIVTIGWDRVGDLSSVKNRDDVNRLVIEFYPDYAKQKARVTSGQLFRFAQVIDVADEVLSYDSARRLYCLGIVTGDYKFGDSGIVGHPHSRSVTWQHEIGRDALSVSTKNSLGSIATLFLVSSSAADEIRRIARGEAVDEDETEEPQIESDERNILEDIQARSREFIKDRVTKLDWDDMQELVAGLLRAMGYKTQVSSKGADRGRDIVASPDGFGFEQPRIVAEVKHRPTEQMRADQIRSFLGGRHKDDKGLYVSTGGFSKDARYEADRAQIPLTLMDLDDLVDGIIDHYENMDSETRTLLPLTRVYWPA